MRMIAERVVRESNADPQLDRARRRRGGGGYLSSSCGCGGCSCGCSRRRRRGWIRCGRRCGHLTILSLAVNTVIALILTRTAKASGICAEVEQRVEPATERTVTWPSNAINAEEVGSTTARIRTKTVVLPPDANPVLDGSRRSRCRGLGDHLTVGLSRRQAHLRIIVKVEAVLARAGNGLVVSAQEVALT